MYTLRIISEKGIQTNHSLGENYIIICRERNPKEFETELLKRFSLKRGTENFKSYKERIHMFVIGSDGKYIKHLYTNQQAYIMTPNGSTFDNLSFLR